MADVTDPNGNVCDSSVLDCAGICNGDAILDLWNKCASPSYENGFASWTDPNGTFCSSGSVDGLGYCYGSCNNYAACGEDGNGCLYDIGYGCGVPAPATTGLPDAILSVLGIPRPVFSIGRVIGLPFLDL